MPRMEVTIHCEDEVRKELELRTDLEVVDYSELDPDDEEGEEEEIVDE